MNFDIYLQNYFTKYEMSEVVRDKFADFGLELNLDCKFCFISACKCITLTKILTKEISSVVIGCMAFS